MSGRPAIIWQRKWGRINFQGYLYDCQASDPCWPWAGVSVSYQMGLSIGYLSAWVSSLHDSYLLPKCVLWRNSEKEATVILLSILKSDTQSLLRYFTGHPEKPWYNVGRYSTGCKYHEVRVTGGHPRSWLPQVQSRFATWIHLEGELKYTSSKSPFLLLGRNYIWVY